jgi:predicted nucleic acid-binding protein
VIIADTSIWVEHIRGKDTPLDDLLGFAPVLLHPFVRGELLLHGLPRTGRLAETLEELDPAPLASCDEVAAFIVWARLQGTGVGYVDTHLLVSARMLPAGKVLTLDRRLNAQAERLGLAF